jgi:hypothetical protein
MFRASVYPSWMDPLFLVGYLTMLSVSRVYGVDDEMINECGAVGGMTTGRGSRSKTCPSDIWSTKKIPHDLTRGRTRVVKRSRTQEFSFSSMRATCLVHAPWPDHPMMSYEEQKLWSSHSNSCHFLPLRSRYPPQHPQSVFFLKCDDITSTIKIIMNKLKS